MERKRMLWLGKEQNLKGVMYLRRRGRTWSRATLFPGCRKLWRRTKRRLWLYAISYIIIPLITPLVLKVLHNLLQLLFLISHESPSDLQSSTSPDHCKPSKVHQILLPLNLVLAISLACSSGFTHNYLLLNFYLLFKEEGQMLCNTFLFSLCPGLTDLFSRRKRLPLPGNILPLRMPSWTSILLANQIDQIPHSQVLSHISHILS